MKKHYEHAASLAAEIDARRQERSLSFDKLGSLAGVDVSQVFRICGGRFKTLNPSVLKICNALSIRPQTDDMVLPPAVISATEAKLSAEVLIAWDRTDAGAKLLIRVLRALRDARHRDLGDSSGA